MKNIIIPAVLRCALLFCGPLNGGEDARGTRSYDDYEKPQTCAGCHTSIYRQ